MLTFCSGYLFKKIVKLFQKQHKFYKLRKSIEKETELSIKQYLTYHLAKILKYYNEV